jgi:hypothetical protein
VGAISSPTARFLSVGPLLDFECFVAASFHHLNGDGYRKPEIEESTEMGHLRN